MADDLAYIAVTRSGFVEGSCSTAAEDAQQWLSDMEAAGMAIQSVSRAEAKRVLFTQLKIATLEA